MNVGFIICGQLRLSVLLGPTEKCTNRRRPYLHWPHVRDCASVKFDLFSAQAKNNWSLTLRRFRKHYWVPIAISVGTRSGMKTPHIPSWVSCEEWGADQHEYREIDTELMIKILAFAHHATSHGFIDDFWIIPACSKEYFSQGYSYFELVVTFNCSSTLPCLGAPAGTSHLLQGALWLPVGAAPRPEQRTQHWYSKIREAPDFTGAVRGEQSGIWKMYALELSCLASLRSQAVCRQWGTGKRATV